MCAKFALMGQVNSTLSGGLHVISVIVPPANRYLLTRLVLQFLMSRQLPTKAFVCFYRVDLDEQISCAA